MNEAEWHKIFEKLRSEVPVFRIIHKTSDGIITAMPGDIVVDNWLFKKDGKVETATIKPYYYEHIGNILMRGDGFNFRTVKEIIAALKREGLP